MLCSNYSQSNMSSLMSARPLVCCITCFMILFMKATIIHMASNSNNLNHAAVPLDTALIKKGLHAHDEIGSENLAVQIRQISPDRNSTIKEGDVVRLSCDVWYSSPSDGKLHYQWTKDEQPIGVEQITTIGPIMKELHFHSTYTCRTGNGKKWGTASITLDFDYGPRLRGIVPSSGTTAADKGSLVSLACHYEGRPGPKITWHHSSISAGTVQIGSNFTIKSLSPNATGVYFCCGWVPGFDESCQNFTVIMNDKPKVEVPLLVEAAVGDTVEIPCRIAASPHENKVSWFYSNCESDWVPLNQFLSTKAATRYAEYHDNENNGFQRAILKIINVHGSDFGCYNCTAKNLYGTSYGATKLDEIDETSFFLMISGVIGGLVAILAIALAYFCLNKKYLCHKKKSLMQSDRTSNMTSSDAEAPYYDQIDMPRGSMAYIWDGLAYHPVFITDEPPPPELLDTASVGVLQNYACNSEAIDIPPSSLLSDNPTTSFGSPSKIKVQVEEPQIELVGKPDSNPFILPPKRRQSASMTSPPSAGSSSVLSTTTDNPKSCNDCQAISSSSNNQRRASFGIFTAVAVNPYDNQSNFVAQMPHSVVAAAAAAGDDLGMGTPMLFYVANAGSLINTHTANRGDVGQAMGEGDPLIKQDDRLISESDSASPKMHQVGDLSTSPEKQSLLGCPGQRRAALETVQEVPSPDTDLLNNNR